MAAVQICHFWLFLVNVHLFLLCENLQSWLNLHVSRRLVTPSTVNTELSRPSLQRGFCSLDYNCAADLKSNPLCIFGSLLCIHYRGTLSLFSTIPVLFLLCTFSLLTQRRRWELKKVEKRGGSDFDQSGDDFLGFLLRWHSVFSLRSYWVK